ncbi:EpsG family protein, partial [Phocaeicola vulgatus]
MSISLYIALYYNLLLLLVVYIAIQPVRAETVRQPYINNQIFSLALLLIVYVHVT